MAAPDKRMGKEDLASFLKQQFPKSNEVNNLLEQIIASKNSMEKAMGEEIPSFYGTISRLISAHTVNGISDWVNSNGQVNINRINKAAEIAKKEFEVKKIQEENERQGREQIKSNFENIDNKEIEEKISKIDFDHITKDEYIQVAKWFDKLSKDQQKKVNNRTDEIMGTADVYKMLEKALDDPSILDSLEFQTMLEKFPDIKQRFFPNGSLDFEAVKDFRNKKNILSGQLVEESQERKLTEQEIKQRIEKFGLKPEAFNIVELKKKLDSGELGLEVRDNNARIDEQVRKDLEHREAEQEMVRQEEDIQKDKMVKVATEIATGDTKAVYELEEDFTAMFEDAMDSMMEGAIDLAEELTPDMDGVHIGEGFMYAIEGEERGQAGIDGQEIGEAEDTIIGQVGEVAEMMQQGEDRTGEEVRQDVARDTLDRRTGQEDKTQNSDEMARGQVAPNAMGIIGQLQNAAREEPNDYTQEDTYQTPTLDNLEEDKKGGILGFFSKIKEAIQARFAKKPEQKRLNPSSEQRTDENGWNITTYDGNGKDLVPKSTGIRNAMVRFAENTIGKVAKLTTNAPRSSEPINTPYVIPTNVQSREDKQQVVTKDKTNQWAVDPSRLSPLEHGKKDKDEQVQGDGER